MSCSDRFDFGADAGRPTRELAYGRQRLLEIVLALAARAEGAAARRAGGGRASGAKAPRFLRRWRRCREDIAVLFIEHDMDVVFRFAERITVLVAGQILCEGTPEEIADHPAVREVYLGDDEDV